MEIKKIIKICLVKMGEKDFLDKLLNFLEKQFAKSGKILSLSM